MKKEFQYLALGLFLVVIVALLFGSSGVEPYSKSDLFSKEYGYEGMEGDVEMPVDPEEKKKEEEAALAVPPAAESMSQMGAADKEEHATAPTIASLFSSDKPVEKKEGMFGLDQAYASVQNMFKLPKKEKEEEGFSLSPAEYGGMVLNDKFSSFAEAGAVSTSGTCVSGGLSTSRGPLCLSPELMEILRTRGGNATGK